MKTLDFNKKFIKEDSQQTYRGPVNEFLGTFLVCSVAGMLASKFAMGFMSDIQEWRANMAKHKADRLKSKLEQQQTNAQITEEKMKRAMMAMSNAQQTSDGGDVKDPDGNSMGDLFKALRKLSSGKCSDEDLKLIQKVAQRKTTPEEDKIMDRVTQATTKYTIDDINKYCEEHGIPKNIDTETISKMMDTHKDVLDSSTPQDTPQDTPQEPKGKDDTEEYVDDDGTRYTRNGDKYTMTTKDGNTTEISKDDFESATESDDIKDAERTDNDDDLEDTGDPSDMSQDPGKKWKQRTYKRGNKTFKTKLYYNKKGASISKEAFRSMVDTYEQKQKQKQKGKKKPKNESNMFSFTPIFGMHRKVTPVMETETVTDRVDITNERLVYIKYVMDTTTNNVEKVAMERMYNALLNLTYNSNGEPRTLNDLYTYLNQTMVENKGKIEGLPTESQIENIDQKVQAFKELKPDKFNAYLTRLKKEMLDKNGTKKDDAAADLLHPTGDDTDTQIISKIRDMSSIYGFTNILGLEPDRKPSKEDEKKKDEIKQQQKTGVSTIDTDDNKNVKADDVSDEQIDKIIGVDK